MLLFVSSCAPYAVALNMDMKTKPLAKTDLFGKTVSVELCNTALDTATSALFATAFTKGVSSLLPSVNESPDYKLLIDSLVLGGVSMKEPFHTDDGFISMDVSFPYAFNLVISDNNDPISSPSPVESLKVDDVMYFTLTAKDTVSPKKLKISAYSYLPSFYEEIGRYTADFFFPQWKNVDVIIYTKDSDEWLKAEALADNFQWEEAYKIWIKLVESDNIKDRAAAAHNIAVACEILGKHELSEKWLALSKKVGKKS